MYTHIYPHAYVHKHTNTHTHIYIYIYIKLYTYTHTKYTQIYTYIYIYIYIFIIIFYLSVDSFRWEVLIPKNFGFSFEQKHRFYLFVSLLIKYIMKFCNCSVYFTMYCNYIVFDIEK